VTETYLTEGLSPQSGTVIAFVSPKGGTGKTVIAATTAYLLCKAGKRTVAIDSDFSTRGLSLYLLGSTDDVDPRDENCLAEIILREIPVGRVEPRRIMREGLIQENPLHLILSNQNLWRGGRPDKDFTAGAVPVEYFQRFRDLCSWLRQKYDYVIIDSRGGYDLFSAVPAIVADRYIVVMEADKVSIDQVFGFQRSIAEFARETEITPRNSGFIINKATFAPDDDTVPHGLQSLFDVRTIGVIPADNDCIRAYTNKELPSEKYPYSDFAYYAVNAIDRMINPTQKLERP
jgi:septum site-determining protein MinD